MDIALSIASFPVDDETQHDMLHLLGRAEEEYSMVLHAPFWQADQTRGFAVLAYTEEDELIGFAAAADLVGLHQYEWSVFVHPGFRRHSIGTALADGVAHALVQRGAEGEFAAFIEGRGAEAFLESLGFKPGFTEILLGAAPLENFRLPEEISIVPSEGGDDVWVMKKDGAFIAEMTVVSEETDMWITAYEDHSASQGKDWRQEFLEWSRHHAFLLGKSRVLLDMETENEVSDFYGKAGFHPVSTVAYWEKAEGGQK